MENLNLVGADDEIGKLALEPGGFHNVVVYPMVVATPWFAKQDTVVFKTVFFEPCLGDGAVFLRAGGEKGNDMAFLEPFVDDLEGIGIRRHDGHPLRLLIGHIVANRAVNIYEEVFLLFRQQGAYSFPFFVESGYQLIGKILLLHIRINW